jgi:hypothetical protein
MSMTKRAAAMIVAELMASSMTPTLRKAGVCNHSQEPNGWQNPEAGCPHRWRAGLPVKFSDDLVFAREDAVLIIDGNRAEVLDHDLRQSCLLETLLILRNGQRLVADLSAQHLGDGHGEASSQGSCN